MNEEEKRGWYYKDGSFWVTRYYPNGVTVTKEYLGVDDASGPDGKFLGPVSLKYYRDRSDYNIFWYHHQDSCDYFTIAKIKGIKSELIKPDLFGLVNSLASNVSIEEDEVFGEKKERTEDIQTVG